MSLRVNTGDSPNNSPINSPSQGGGIPPLASPTPRGGSIASAWGIFTLAGRVTRPMSQPNTMGRGFWGKLSTVQRASLQEIPASILPIANTKPALSPISSRTSYQPVPYTPSNDMRVDPDLELFVYEKFASKMPYSPEATTPSPVALRSRGFFKAVCKAMNPVLLADLVKQKLLTPPAKDESNLPPVPAPKPAATNPDSPYTAYVHSDTPDRRASGPYQPSPFAPKLGTEPQPTAVPVEEPEYNFTADQTKKLNESILQYILRSSVMMASPSAIKRVLSPRGSARGSIYPDLLSPGPRPVSHQFIAEAMKALNENSARRLIAKLEESDEKETPQDAALKRALRAHRPSGSHPEYHENKQSIRKYASAAPRGQAIAQTP